MVKKNNKQKNADPQVVEGEIIDSIDADASPSSVATGASGVAKKIIIYIGALWLLAAVVWYFADNIKAYFAGLFDGEQTEQVAEVDIYQTQIDAIDTRLATVHAEASAVRELKERVDRLEAEIALRLDNIDARLITEENKPALQAEAVDGELISQLSELSERIAAIEERVSTQPVAAPVGDDVQNLLVQMEERLRTIEVAEPQSQVVISDDSYYISLIRLSQAISAGGPYETQLLEIKTYYEDMGGDVAHELEQTSALSAWSQKGVPTNKEIMQSFYMVSPLALKAEQEQLESSWWQRLMASIKGLVVVRKTGEVEGGDIEAQIARAEVRLKRSDYAEALEILLGTTLLEQQALAPVIEMIESRVEANKASNALLTAALGLAEGVNNSD